MTSSAYLGIPSDHSNPNKSATKIEKNYPGTRTMTLLCIWRKEAAEARCLSLVGWKKKMFDSSKFEARGLFKVELWLSKSISESTGHKHSPRGIAVFLAVTCAVL